MKNGGCGIQPMIFFHETGRISQLVHRSVDGCLTGQITAWESSRGRPVVRLPFFWLICLIHQPLAPNRNMAECHQKLLRNVICLSCLIFYFVLFGSPSSWHPEPDHTQIHDFTVTAAGQRLLEFNPSFFFTAVDSFHMCTITSPWLLGSVILIPLVVLSYRS